MFSLSKLLQTFSLRSAALLTGTFCAGLLLFALILEHFVELTPCPLCIAQRFFFVLILFVSLAFVYWGKVVTPKIAGIKIMAYAFLGGAIAARQVWMQWNVENIDTSRCGVMFGSFIDQLLQALGGTGSCALVDWTFLTLSIAEWSLLCFILLFFVGVWFLWRGSREQKI